MKYNDKDDPFEKNNLASIYPCRVRDLENELSRYKESVVEPLLKEPLEKNGDWRADFFGGKWSPGWC